MFDRAIRLLGLCSFGLLLGLGGPVRAAFPDPAAPPVVATNYVLVTNMVLVTVTNYVVTKQTVLITNGGAAVVVSRAPLPALGWGPPEDGFDWIQLKSGEWLKGRLKAMQDRELEFDSEEMELQTFEWKDILQVRSPHMNEMLFEKVGAVSGPVTITPSEVIVGGTDPRVLPRSELQSLTPGGAKERNFWSGRVSVGLSLQSGNTKSVDYNATVSLQRRTPATRFSFDYLGNVTTSDSVETANNQRVNAEYDYWMTRRLYLILPFAEYFHDPFQNIDRRLTLGAGVGYDLVDRPGLEWNISTGPAYQQTRFASVQPGEPIGRGTAALTFGSKFDWDITRRINLLLEYRGQYTTKEAGETFHHSVSTLDFKLTKRFDLDVSFIWDRIQTPTQESNGDVPQQNDFRLIIGLGVRF